VFDKLIFYISGGARIRSTRLSATPYTTFCFLSWETGAFFFLCFLGVIFGGLPCCPSLGPYTLYQSCNNTGSLHSHTVGEATLGVDTDEDAQLVVGGAFFSLTFFFSETDEEFNPYL
jgi:hypothetical protein